jgi:hypothetical protein
MLKMLIQQVMAICNVESPDKGINNLKRTFRQAGHSTLSVTQALVPKQRPQIQHKKPPSISMIPYQQSQTKSTDS